MKIEECVVELGDSGQRQLSRDSLFLMADVRLDGEPGDSRVRVRNLSAGGLMAEGLEKPRRGQTVWVKLRNIGLVEGTIAWVQDNRCGVAFSADIDPMVVRAPVASGEGTPRFVKPPLAQYQPGQLRKI